MAELSKEQESLIIDFLKRWGIDSPELVFELTDHYCEKAKDQIKQGWSFEKVLDSWKTKNQFHVLKKIQANFETTIKEQWKKNQIEAFKTIFKSTQLLWLLGSFLLIVLATFAGVGLIVFVVCAAISALYFIGFAYFYWIKKFQRIFEFRDNLIGGLIYYWCINYFIQSAETNGFLNSSSLLQWQTVLAMVVITLSFYQYNLYSKLWQKVKGLTEEHLTEHEKPQLARQ
jgi:hypothetical protein